MFLRLGQPLACSVLKKHFLLSFSHDTTQEHACLPAGPAPCVQSYYDWMAWPVSGDAKLDERQMEEKGRVLEPLTRLFFAGEATHKDDSYTVQGALLSGATSRIFENFA
jgi:hypothetical protein